MARHGDDHRDIGAQGALDQKRKAFSLALLPSEPVDDHEIRALIDRAGDLRTCIQQLGDIQSASRRARAEVLEQLQLFPCMDQHGRQFRRIEAMMA